MAHFKSNSRGGLSVDRDSLHASPEFKRQIEALSKLSGNPMTLPQNVKDAVDYIDASGFKGAPVYESSWQTIRAHLMSQEAEIDRLRCDADDNRDAFGELLSAFHKSESRLAAANVLLREALQETLSNIGFMAIHDVADGSIQSAMSVAKRIQSYLQGE